MNAWLAISQPRPTQKSVFARWGAVLLMAAAAGCSHEAARRPVFGTITSSTPVVAVTFRPAEGATGPAAAVDVINNQYRFTSSNGPVAGWHEVIFTLAAPEPKPTNTAVKLTSAKASPKPSLPKTDKIPPMVLSTRLPPTVRIEVPASGSLQLDLTVPPSTR